MRFSSAAGAGALGKTVAAGEESGVPVRCAFIRQGRTNEILFFKALCSRCVLIAARGRQNGKAASVQPPFLLGGR
jgi:hypothetical protein